MKYLEFDNLNMLVKEGIHLVDFYAEWCAPCKILANELDKIKDKIDVIKVDIDKFMDLATQYKIMSVPTMIFFKDGEKIEELIGYHTEEELLEIIENL